MALGFLLLGWGLGIPLINAACTIWGSPLLVTVLYGCAYAFGLGMAGGAIQKERGGWRE